MPTCREALIKALSASGKENCFDSSTVAKENKMEFRIENRSKKTICRVKVDGCLVGDHKTKRCDFFFKVCETQQYVLVELKGSNVEDAFPQLMNTYSYLKDKLGITASQFEAFVVSTRVPKATNKKVAIHKKKYLREHGLSVQIKNQRASLVV